MRVVKRVIFFRLILGLLLFVGFFVCFLMLFFNTLDLLFSLLATLQCSYMNKFELLVIVFTDCIQRKMLCVLSEHKQQVTVLSLGQNLKPK